MQLVDAIVKLKNYLQKWPDSEEDCALLRQKRKVELRLE